MISPAFTIEPEKIGYAPYKITVTDTTEEPEDDPIVSRVWTWGGGTTSEENTHTYNVSGVYNLTLTITTESGKTATSAIIPITVITRPTNTADPVGIADLKGIYINVM